MKSFFFGIARFVFWFCVFFPLKRQIAIVLVCFTAGALLLRLARHAEEAGYPGSFHRVVQPVFVTRAEYRQLSPAQKRMAKRQAMFAWPARPKEEWDGSWDD